MGPAAATVTTTAAGRHNGAAPFGPFVPLGSSGMEASDQEYHLISYYHITSLHITSLVYVHVLVYSYTCEWEEGRNRMKGGSGDPRSQFAWLAFVWTVNAAFFTRSRL